MENISDLEKLLRKIIDKGAFQYFWSFHTLTFNIIEQFNKDDLQKGIKIYLSWLKRIYVENEKNKIKSDNYFYIYTYEITEKYHIHIHLLLNKIVSEDDKADLIKKWNNYNDWKFYNEKGLVIKNDNEYENYTKIDEPWLDIEKKAQQAEFRYTDILNIIKYMFKNINDFENVLKLYYMIYPIKIVNGVYNIKFVEYINNLNELYLKTIYNFFNLYNPFLNKEHDETKLLKYVYMKWKNHMQSDYPELIELFEQIENEKNKSKKQEIIENYLSQKKEVINECKLYCIGKDDFQKFQKNLLSLIEKKIIENNHCLIFCLEKKENTIYYILETLIKVVRFYKSNIKEEGYDDWETEKTFLYTEAYFKFIMQNLYQTQIISVNYQKKKMIYIKI